MFVERSGALRQIAWRWSVHPAIAVRGPRQCGKTTLAKQVAAAEPDSVIFDLENEADRVRLQHPEEALAPLRGLVVIDEIQQMPRLFNVLRVLIDRTGATTRYLLAGSVSPAIVPGVSQSLAGRVGLMTLSGFDLGEVAERPGGWPLLWERGGMPNSYLSSTTRGSSLWRREYIENFMEADVSVVGPEVTAAALRRCWTLLADHHGGLWNAAAFARELGTGEKQARRCLDLLAGAFVVRVLPPWFRSVKKRQVRSPKVYVRDTGMLHAMLDLSTAEEIADSPKAGASFEGFVIEQILDRAGEWQAYFWGTHGGAELDLVLTRNGKRYGFEVKYTESPKTTKSMRIASEALDLERLFVVYPGADRYDLDARIEALPVNDIASVLEPPPWESPEEFAAARPPYGWQTRGVPPPPR